MFRPSTIRMVVVGILSVLVYVGRPDLALPRRHKLVCFKLTFVKSAAHALAHTLAAVYIIVWQN